MQDYIYLISSPIVYADSHAIGIAECINPVSISTCRIRLFNWPRRFVGL